jgi:hypothetical protein
LHRRSVPRSQESLTPAVAAGEVADIPRQLRIRKRLHRIRLRCRIPAVAVVRIQAAVLLILPARIPAAVLLVSLARVRVLARTQAQRHTLRPAAVRIPLLLVTAAVMVRVMRLRRRGQRTRHKLTNPPGGWVMPIPPQTTVSTQTLRTTVSTQMSEVEMLQIV